MTQKLAEKKLAALRAGKLGGILLRAYLKQELFAPKRVTPTAVLSRGTAAVRAKPSSPI